MKHDAESKRGRHSQSIAAVATDQSGGLQVADQAIVLEKHASQSIADGDNVGKANCTFTTVIRTRDV